jgi:hypothetical protein
MFFFKVFCKVLIFSKLREYKVVGNLHYYSKKWDTKPFERQSEHIFC